MERERSNLQDNEEQEHRGYGAELLTWVLAKTGKRFHKGGKYFDLGLTVCHQIALCNSEDKEMQSWPDVNLQVVSGQGQIWVLSKGPRTYPAPPARCNSKVEVREW